MSEKKTLVGQVKQLQAQITDSAGMEAKGKDSAADSSVKLCTAYIWVVDVAYKKNGLRTCL